MDNKTLKVSDAVTWIGVLDHDIVTFDVVMETQYGTTYNSYFINAEKKTVVETVKEKFWPVFEAKLRSLTDPGEIEYIIVNHTEPDHSGCIGRLLEIAPKAVVVGSGNAIRYLTDLLGRDFPHKVVKDGHILDLGNMKIRFIGASNLHWPDSMMSWLEEDQLLFTCDIFGEHFCREEMFDDELPDFEDAFRYYYDVIMKPYSRFMLQAIERMKDLPVKAICTGHGAILRKHWKKYVELSAQYARDYLMSQRTNQVFIGYVSAYHNTGMIAEKVAEGIRKAGNIEVDLCDIEKMTLPEIEKHLTEASGIILGCPTFSQNILLPIYQVFALINPIRDRNKLAGAFGSYGWSGEGAKIITSALAQLKLHLFDDGLMIKFTPHNEILDKCVEWGNEYGKKFLELKNTNAPLLATS